MFGHVSLAIADFKRSRAVYDAVLAPSDVTVLFEAVAENGKPYAACGLDRPMFWLNSRGAIPGPVHIGFEAGSRAAVGAFHRAAVAAGGRDNGPPGLRPQHHADYYGAFVLNPAGLNVEAVYVGAA